MKAEQYQSRTIRAKLACLSDGSSHRASPRHRSAPARCWWWDTAPSPGVPSGLDSVSCGSSPHARAPPCPCRQHHSSIAGMMREKFSSWTLQWDRAPGHGRMPVRGCAHSHPAPTAQGWADTGERAALVPKDHSQQTLHDLFPHLPFALLIESCACVPWLISGG